LRQRRVACRLLEDPYLCSGSPCWAPATEKLTESVRRPWSVDHGDLTKAATRLSGRRVVSVAKCLKSWYHTSKARFGKEQSCVHHSVPRGRIFSDQARWIELIVFMKDYYNYDLPGLSDLLSGDSVPFEILSFPGSL